VLIKKAVVTGASGFIGSAMVRYLVEKGVKVTGFDRIPCKQDICESYVYDMCQPGVLDQHLDEETVVFHFAAHADVASSVKDPRTDFNLNIMMLFEVLESVRRANCQLIFPSTGSIFDISNKLPLSEKAYVKPTSPYAASKVAGEAYCAAYHRSYGLNIKIARMFSVYGVGMDRFAIHDLIRKIQKNNMEIELLGDGNQIRDYLYIDDVVRGLALIAENGSPGEDYNLASGIPVKLIDLANLIATLMGLKNIKIIPTGKSFPGDVPRWYADITKIQSIGFKPKISLENGLLKTITWLCK